MDVARMTTEERLGETFQRTERLVGPDVGRQLHALIEPQSLAILAGVLAAWAISHAFGVGEAIDIILGVVGVFSIGLAVFSGLDHLTRFALAVNSATTEANLDHAAHELSEAIAILGVTAVLAFLFRGRPSVRRIEPGPPPPATPGWRYRPTTTYEPLPKGTLGTTDSWGNIKISTLATASEQKVALLHEGFHRFLTPRLYLLRNFRVANRDGSYFNSSLWRYLEEAIAQTIGKTGGEGFSKILTGISFPVKNGYVYLVRRGGYNPLMGGKGLFPEGAGLLATGMMAGQAVELWFKRQEHNAAAPGGHR